MIAEKHLLSQPDYLYPFPLCAAIDQCDVDCLQLLLDNGSPTETEQCKTQGYPLHFAIQSNHPRLVAEVLKCDQRVCLHSSKPDFQCSWKQMFQTKNSSILKLLVNSQATTKEELCTHGKTSLYLSISTFHFYEAVEPLLKAKLVTFCHQGHNILDFMIMEIRRLSNEKKFFNCLMNLLQYGVDIQGLQNIENQENIIYNYIQLLHRTLTIQPRPVPSEEKRFDDLTCYSLCTLPGFPKNNSPAEKLITILFCTGFTCRKKHFLKTNTWNLFCQGTEFSQTLCHQALHVNTLKQICRQVLRKHCGIYPQEKLKALPGPKKILDYLLLKTIQ